MSSADSPVLGITSSSASAMLIRFLQSFKVDVVVVRVAFVLSKMDVVVGDRKV